MIQVFFQIICNYVASTASSYIICILVYVSSVICYFYAIPYTIRGVPVSKSENLSSDPNFLVIYEQYSSCLLTNRLIFVFLVILNIAVNFH